MKLGGLLDATTDPSGRALPVFLPILLISVLLTADILNTFFLKRKIKPISFSELDERERKGGVERHR